jgi:predicted ArsR family transcriptional regulator
MSTPRESSDAHFVALLRDRGPLSIAEITAAEGVTATAIRQRLNRLMEQGLVQRQVIKASEGSRGRPSHRYELTEKARRQAGANFGDLAAVLWQELRQVRDPEVRRGLLKRIATSMAGMYAGQMHGETIEERMEALRELLGERGVRFQVNRSGSLPILEAVDCPYPELAAVDRSVCAMEKMVFDELLGQNVRLTQCRFSDEEPAAAGSAKTCCRFQTV